mmetsp:Transcript_32221/g.102728  ORF Transcript_32221/g.102728 Transcript_32221/m.102728 type:complete len:389 (+) Transcript_32221:66-1232(+)
MVGKVVLLFCGLAEALVTTPPTKGKATTRGMVMRGGGGGGRPSGGNNPIIITLPEQASLFVKKNFFVLGMAGAVGLAALKPELGVDGSFLRPEKVVGDYGVALIFLLSGLSLKLSELRSAVMNVKLNSVIQMISLLVWPLGAAAMSGPLRAVGVNAKILDGLLVTSCLPTTINMCVMLTSSANGNVAAALANAVVGNFLGVIVTPLLLFATMRKAVALPVGKVVSKLAVKVLLPVFVGQGLRANQRLLALQATHKAKFKLASELTLLAIAWNAFCNSFTSGLGISLSDVLLLELGLAAVHGGALVLLKNFFSKVLRTPKEDAIAAAFVASQKTLAMGLPLIKTVFAGSPDLAFFCAPIMLLHPTQLLIGSLLVPRWQQYQHPHQRKKE